MGIHDRVGYDCSELKSGEPCKTTALGELIRVSSDPSDTSIVFWYNTTDKQLKVREEGGAIIRFDAAPTTTSTTVSTTSTTTTTVEGGEE